MFIKRTICTVQEKYTKIYSTKRKKRQRIICYFIAIVLQQIHDKSIEM